MTVSIETLRASLNNNVKERSDYEISKDANEKITSQLIKHFTLDHKTLETKLSDAFFEACASLNIQSFDFINDAKRSNNRFNIKALEKVRAIIDSVYMNTLVKATKTANKYNVALCATLLKQRTNDEFKLTRKHAYAMFSMSCRYDTVRVTDFAQKLKVQESTALTQASSSFRALAACNVCSFDDESKIVSNIDHESAFMRILSDVVAA